MLSDLQVATFWFISKFTSAAFDRKSTAVFEELLFIVLPQIAHLKYGRSRSPLPMNYKCCKSLKVVQGHS